MNTYDMQLANNTKILSSKTQLSPEENIHSFNIDAKMVVIPTPRNKLSEVNLEQYYETTYKDNGIGWVDITFGAMTLIIGVLLFASGFLLLGVTAALMVMGGVMTIASGATGIAAGILRPSNHRLANILAYVSIGLGVAGMITGITAARTAGLVAARGVGRLMNSRIIYSSRARTTSTQLLFSRSTREIMAATTYVSNVGGDYLKVFGSPSMLSGAIFTAAGRATSSGVFALNASIAGSGLLLSGINAAYGHSMRNKAIIEYDKDLEKMNSGGIS